MGEEAKYEFRFAGYAQEPDVSAYFLEWSYDGLGRKVAETVYDDSNDVVAQTLFVWDGWRLISEIDATTGKAVAEYVPGPNYVDDTVAVRRDLDRNGNFAGEGFLYFLTDQQHSTVALLDETGNLVERYGYDAFGTPTYYDGAGTALADTNSDNIIESEYGNTRLYTGREYLPGPRGLRLPTAPLRSRRRPLPLHRPGL